MTDLLDHAFEIVRALPSDAQNELARVLLQLAGEEQPFADLTPEDEAAALTSRAAAARGDFATDEEISAIWAKHGL